ncbi:MAG: radical SAM family heme chaperone HemW [Rickettsiales bacterium]|jgi:oxygen-independent coproporphyrinogen-3 oxidase|nr:radical SAM family heme chaperone HemW [Rickettsiales bacterium]
MEEKLSLYVHYPFCKSKCPYCDFNSYPDGNRGSLETGDFLKAYIREITHYREILGPRTVNTVFFGGGTPSLMSIDFTESILSQIGRLFSLEDGLEISLEANPTTLETGKFGEFRALGINRLSIGIQSFSGQNLKFLGRTYSETEALEALDVAQRCFGDSYSIDLIYALPGQNVGQWLEELEKAAILSPNHMSLYQLTIEPGTEFHRRGVRPMDDGEEAEIYRITNEFLEFRDISLYEISNYARPGYRCRHNMNYWNSGQWLGIGAGAHSRLCFGDKLVNGYRERMALENIKNPSQWQKQVLKLGHGLDVSEMLTREEFIEEILLMGLRLRDGLVIDNVRKYLTLGPGGFLELFGKDYEQLAVGNYIEISDKNIRIPLENLRILDSIVKKIL